MKTRLITLLSAMAFVAISCEEDPDKGSVWDDPKFVRVVTPTETVISGNKEVEIYYKEGQLLKVWETDGSAVNLKINKDKDSVFFSYEWIPDAVPAYAAFPAAEDATCSADGIFGVTVGTTQTVSKAGEIENFYAVGKVTGANRTSYKASPIKNLTGFLALNLGFPLIESITIESVAGEPLAGRISVDCTKLYNSETDYMTLTEEVQSSVTIVPAEADATLGAGMYYVALLPGTYTKGLRLTVDYKVGDTVEKTYFADGVTIVRSDLGSFGSGYADDDLPDEVRVDLTFSEGWPFEEAIVSAEEQEAANFSGDTYAHMLTYQADGVEKQKGLAFFVKGNAQAYEYSQNVFKPGARNARITLPALPGRYIRAVRMETGNSSQYPKGFKLTNMSWNDLATCAEKAYEGSPATLSFPTENGAASELEAAYYMYFIDGSPTVTTISILYSRQLPSSYDDNPFGEVVLPDEVVLAFDFKSGWPFKEPCASEQVSAGESYTYDYSWEVDGVKHIKTLEFKIRKGNSAAEEESYEHVAGKGLLFNSTDEKRAGNDYGAVQFPAIQGRYFRSLSATISTELLSDNKYGWRRFYLMKDFTPGVAYSNTGGKGASSAYLRLNESTTYVFELPITSDNPPYTADYSEGKGSGDLSSEKNIPYSMRLREIDNCVEGFTIVYTKEQPTLPTTAAE